MANRKMLCVAASATRGNARETEGWKTRVLRVLNLRGHRTPEYILPENASYMSLFVKGGPRRTSDSSVASCCTLHTKYTERACVCSALRTRSEPTELSCVRGRWRWMPEEVWSEVLAKFATTHPRGVQRDWVRSTLTRWKCHLEQKSAQTHPPHSTTHAAL